MPRLILASLAVLLAVAAARAEDIITRDGTTYADVTITLVEPDGITIRHADGVVKIHARHLSDEDRARFHLTPEAARAYAEQRRKAFEAHERSVRKAEEDARERVLDRERQKRQDAIDEAMWKKRQQFRLYCLVSNEKGVICTGISGKTDYFIPGYSAMPDTWFEVTAVKLKRVKLSSTSSAIELRIVHPPKKR